MKKNLLLIYPYQLGNAVGYGETSGLGLPPLGLGIIAALTPDNWNIKIIDETVEPINFDEKCDLVGLSVLTANVNRGYEICDKFRKRHVPVIMGGIHCSLLPDEALHFADCVVIGEAENIWGKVIDDFEKGVLQKRYEGERPTLVNMPWPRRDLYRHKYETDVIQTTRGCPFNCEFCVVTRFNGHKFRTRPVNEVLDELASIKSKIVYMLDDNFFGGANGKDRAMAIFKGMIDRKLNKYWATQTTVNIADDDEVLEYAYKSGCRGIYIGIESVDRTNLQLINKTSNIKLNNDGIKQSIKRMHKHGIAVLGAFIFGCDNDDVSIFQKTLDFINDTGLDMFDLSMPMPYPGTKMYDRLEKEGRLIYRDFPAQWSLYNEQNVLIKPTKMSICDLVRGFDYVVQKKLSISAIVIQGFRTLWNTRSIVSTWGSFRLNLSNRKIYDNFKKFRNKSSSEEICA